MADLLEALIDRRSSDSTLLQGVMKTDFAANLDEHVLRQKASTHVRSTNGTKW
jgi:hypothetical protein